jgi:hypothetical protein
MTTTSATPENAAWVRDQLAARFPHEQFPHLSVSFELRDGTIYVDAVPA